MITACRGGTFERPILTSHTGAAFIIWIKKKKTKDEREKGGSASIAIDCATASVACCRQENYSLAVLGFDYVCPHFLWTDLNVPLPAVHLCVWQWSGRPCTSDSSNALRKYAVIIGNRILRSQVKYLLILSRYLTPPWRVVCKPELWIVTIWNKFNNFPLIILWRIII